MILLLLALIPISIIVNILYYEFRVPKTNTLDVTKAWVKLQFNRKYKV